jgi:adenine-specific DNA methylase
MAWIELQPTPQRLDLIARIGPPGDHHDPSQGTVKASSATCPTCGTSIPAKDVREYGKRTGFGRRLYAVLVVGDEKVYRAPTREEIEGAELVAPALIDTLAETPDGTSAVPDEQITKSQFRIIRSLVYGVDTFRGLFNDRQLYVLGLLCQTVRDAYNAILAEGMEKGRARAIATYLAFCIDRVADRNSSFCTWGLNPGGFAASVRNTFPQQAIRMAWNYVEIDPFQSGSGSWDGAVRWIQAAITHCSAVGSVPATVVRANAQMLPFDNATFDAVIVDPPYYDAIQYGDLSDFFYVWLKRSIGHLYPDLFSTPLTPKRQEVIETRADKKSPEYVSHEEFEARLQRALAEMARVTRSDGTIAIVFAHTDVAAWERLLRGLRATGLIVSTSWPMRSEMTNRSTATISAVLGSCVVLVCRKAEGIGEGFYDDVVRQLEARIAERLGRFEAMGLVGADYFASAVGPAFEVFAQYAKVVRLSGEEVGVGDLMILARQVVARRAMGRLLGDRSVSDLDPVSLLYLTWRWAYRDQSIPADEAYKLERALDVDLSLLEGPTGLTDHSKTGFALRSPEARRGLKLGPSPLVVDVLHQACLLWDAGRRRELVDLLANTEMADDKAFWSLARALVEVLDEGDRERTMLLGLTGNQDSISSAAAASAQPRPEQQKLL